MLIKSIALLLLLSIMSIAFADEWDAAARKIYRAKPQEFTNIPKELVSKIENSGCTIPQTYGSPKLHNIISGEFSKKGQKDWAILCSDGGVTSILVFWGGSSQCADEFSASKDSHFLQGIGDGKLGYSRWISTVGDAFIQEQFKEYGGNLPPEITHDGIDDYFLEKASVVRYYHNGTWLELTGVD